MSRWAVSSYCHSVTTTWPGNQVDRNSKFKRKRKHKMRKNQFAGRNWPRRGKNGQGEQKTVRRSEVKEGGWGLWGEGREGGEGGQGGEGGGRETGGEERMQHQWQLWPVLVLVELHHLTLCIPQWGNSYQTLTAASHKIFVTLAPTHHNNPVLPHYIPISTQPSQHDNSTQLWPVTSDQPLIAAKDITFTSCASDILLFGASLQQNQKPNCTSWWQWYCYILPKATIQGDIDWEKMCILGVSWEWRCVWQRVSKRGRWPIVSCAIVVLG